MFYQIFLSPQVKRRAIITYKHGIYELPHELPNDLRLKNGTPRHYPTAFSPLGGPLCPHKKKKRLKKIGNIRKVSKPHRMIA